jgi:dienelactone hydrolase
MIGTPVFPWPAGNYAVGTASYHLIDQSRKENWADRSAFRELMMQVWYPSNGNSGNYAFYMTGIIGTFKKIILEYANIPLADLSYLDSLSTHAIINASVVPSKTKYPLIFISQGWGASRFSYTVLAQDLASHGYVVAAVDHPYESFETQFPDGRQIPYSFVTSTTQDDVRDHDMMVSQLAVRIQDVQYALMELMNLNRHDHLGLLTNTIDTDNWGMIGHSFGAAVVTHFCVSNSRCKGAINLDGWLFSDRGIPVTEDIKKPYMMVIAQEMSNTFDEEIISIQNPVESSYAANEYGQSHEWKLYQKLSQAAYYVLFKGALHSSFSDFNVIIPLSTSKNHIDPQYALSITCTLAKHFFDMHIKNEYGEEGIIAYQRKYPELVIQQK